MRRPPPPPPKRRARRPTIPSDIQGRSKLAEAAKQLRDEQLKAQIVYVAPESETNAELDAITAKVVSELKQLQEAGRSDAQPITPAQVQRGLTEALQTTLEKMLSARREAFVRHKVEQFLRRLVSLYMSAEVRHSESTAFESVYDSPDAALLAAYRRHHEAIVKDLRAMNYIDPTIANRAIERLTRFQRGLATDVFARTKPELERLLSVFREVLIVFLLRDLRSRLPEFCQKVISLSGVSMRNQHDYKLEKVYFPAFRRVFEDLFLDYLLEGLQAPLSSHIAEGDWRSETRRFAEDPQLYAELCGVLCNAVYDYLHGEGFLDLPTDWQELLQDST